MTITLDPELESRLREQAQAEGLSVPAYVTRLLTAHQDAQDRLESLALEGLLSGDPIEPGQAYWEEKHRRLDESLKRQ